MSRTAKTFCGFFLILACMALGGDVYIWYNSDGHPFAFAALGYLTKTYVPEYHQLVVDALTPEVFNQILAPILAISAFFLGLALAGISLVIGGVFQFIGANTKGQMAPKNKAFKYNRK